MTAIELLAHLRSLGVVLWHNRDKIKYCTQNGVLTAELRSQLIEKKAEIISILRDEIPSPPKPEINNCRLIHQSGSMTWYEDASGNGFRYFPSLDCSFPVEVVREGAPAICTKCGVTYKWLSFPALAGLCRQCQPSSIDWIPEPGEPRFESGVEFRRGPTCYACGETERWRKNKLGPWICKICHPPA
jgi:hypothetical protein